MKLDADRKAYIASFKRDGISALDLLELFQEFVLEEQVKRRGVDVKITFQDLWIAIAEAKESLK